MDIVKRLRALGEEDFYLVPATAYRACQDAANEIEKLRAALNEIAQGDIDDGGNRKNHISGTVIARRVLGLAD